MASGVRLLKGGGFAINSLLVLIALLAPVLSHGQSNVSAPLHNATQEYRQLHDWVPGVGVATLFAVLFIVSLACYLLWLSKPVRVEGRERSRSNSSDLGSSAHVINNPLFSSFRNVYLSGGAGVGGSFSHISASDDLNKDEKNKDNKVVRL